ncbi:type IV pilus modification protein PilV [Legionella sainthelensi]|uniref:type IV pilus modification protein PilV n=1 Tax=Legionella sainthelensi TaxID=28087 RepID=UPI000F6D4FB9|nr:type IV pilus modification protein PilV [Legionella sainthelensi]VEH30404.1 pre-pilin leader sequence (pilV) [Legionella sainthelensi]
MYHVSNLGVRQKGLSLIEVLVAFVILAIGMLGIASMLILSSKANNSSYAKQQAVQCAYDIFDKMRANYQAAINGNYNISNINSMGTPTLPQHLARYAICPHAQAPS